MRKICRKKAQMAQKKKTKLILSIAIGSISLVFFCAFCTAHLENAMVLRGFECGTQEIWDKAS